MIFGYARVSTLDQSEDLQVDKLKASGVEKLFIDKKSGSVKNRPELEKLKVQLREGDTVMVYRLDRLGRSIKDLIELITFFEQEQITFKSLTENIDTSTPSGKLIFHIFSALSEFERNLIVERTKAGLASARARGRTGGRPKKLPKKKIKRLKELYNKKEMTVKEICDWAGISKGTLYNYI